VLSLLLLVGCAFLLTLSVRAQRRDFAVLRALGARRHLAIAVASIVAANLVALIPARHAARPMHALLDRER
jgi:ABC-type lipoprotein release transport system permease subunit